MSTLRQAIASQLNLSGELAASVTKQLEELKLSVDAHGSNLEADQQAQKDQLASLMITLQVCNQHFSLRIAMTV